MACHQRWHDGQHPERVKLGPLEPLPYAEQPAEVAGDVVERKAVADGTVKAYLCPAWLFVVKQVQHVHAPHLLQREIVVQKYLF